MWSQRLDKSKVTLPDTRTNRPHVVMLAQVDDLADHLLPSRVRAGVRSLRAVAQTVGAELSITLEPDVEACSADALIPAGHRHAAADFLGVPNDGQPPGRSFA